MTTTLWDQFVSLARGAASAGAARARDAAARARAAWAGHPGHRCAGRGSATGPSPAPDSAAGAESLPALGSAEGHRDTITVRAFQAMNRAARMDRIRANLGELTELLAYDMDLTVAEARQAVDEAFYAAKRDREARAAGAGRPGLVGVVARTGAHAAPGGAL